MQVAIISIGTELTIGQIINKNSAWIAKNLKALGVPTRCHLTVPDDRDLILEALKFCSERCDTLFVTGGLGPTTDDFTRDIVSEWSGRALEFDETSWAHVNKRLKSRDSRVLESQRQQCFFPKDSILLPNPEGTANGFRLNVFNKEVLVLPGPPSEIEAIWKSSIADFIHERTKEFDKVITYSWDTLGVGESEVADITENCLNDLPLEKGYRAHFPYVEVKLTFPESQTEQLKPAIQRLEECLRPITITRNGEDVPSLIAKKLSQVRQLQVVDSLSTHGVLTLLSPALRDFMSREKNAVPWAPLPAWSFTNHEDPGTDPQVLKMVLKPWDTTAAIAEISYHGATFKTIIEASASLTKMTERRALYFAERAMIFWLHKLEDLL